MLSWLTRLQEKNILESKLKKYLDEYLNDSNFRLMDRRDLKSKNSYLYNEIEIETQNIMKFIGDFNKDETLNYELLESLIRTISELYELKLELKKINDIYYDRNFDKLKEKDRLIILDRKENLTALNMRWSMDISEKICSLDKRNRELINEWKKYLFYPVF